VTENARIYWKFARPDRPALLIAHAYVCTLYIYRLPIDVLVLALKRWVCGDTYEATYGTHACTSPMQSAELKPNQTHYSMHGRRLDSTQMPHTDTIFIEGNLFFSTTGQSDPGNHRGYWKLYCVKLRFFHKSLMYEKSFLCQQFNFPIEISVTWLNLSKS